MARGVRKSPAAKLQEQLNDVRESIRQYENCLETLKEREEELLKQLELEEFKSLRSMLAKRGIGMEELKEMLESNVTAAEESA